VKYGRRPWVRALRALARANRTAPTDHVASIEIVCIALASFRYSEQWQEIGRAGAWHRAWVRMWGMIRCGNPFTFVLARDHGRAGFLGGVLPVHVDPWCPKDRIYLMSGTTVSCTVRNVLWSEP